MFHIKKIKTVFMIRKEKWSVCTSLLPLLLSNHSNNSCCQWKGRLSWHGRGTRGLNWGKLCWGNRENNQNKITRNWRRVKIKTRNTMLDTLSDENEILQLLQLQDPSLKLLNNKRLIRHHDSLSLFISTIIRLNSWTSSLVFSTDTHSWWYYTIQGKEM